MINLNEIQKINLHNNFDEFCTSQVNCKECELRKHELINEGYDQPCEPIHSLLTIMRTFGGINNVIL